MASPQNGPPSSKPFEDRTYFVLLVDDEVDILTSLQELLERGVAKTRVLTASSARQAIQILQREPIDLILSDYKMPSMDGLQFLLEAQRIAPLARRILITAFPDLGLAINAINEARIQLFITKPLDPDKVVTVVKKLLQERRDEELRDRAFARSLDELRRRLKAKR